MSDEEEERSGRDGSDDLSLNETIEECSDQAELRPHHGLDDVVETGRWLGSLLVHQLTERREPG